MSQAKQDKSPETKSDETEASDLPDVEFKITFTEMLTEVRRAMYEQRENFNRDRKY